MSWNAGQIFSIRLTTPSPAVTGSVLATFLISATASFKRWQARCDPFHPNGPGTKPGFERPRVFRWHRLKIFWHTGADALDFTVFTLAGRRPGTECISALGAVQSAKNYMAKTDNPRGMTKAVRELKKKTPMLDQLQSGEAALVLRRLLAGHPELLPEAEEIARCTLGDISFETIASEVEDSIRQLSLDDLDGRAGRHSWGYTEPAEAAWQLLEEAVEPFVEDMKRHVGLGLHEEAFEICKGIVLGLYQCRNAGGDEFLGWAEDFPAEAAGNAVTEWIGASKQGSSGNEPSRNQALLLQEFVDKHVPEWQWIYKRVMGKKGK